MKILISILMFPAFIVLGLSSVCWGFVRCMMARPELTQDTAAVHSLKGCIYIAIGCGLPLTVAAAAFGAVLVILSFIFKSWTRAIVSGAIAFAAVMMWLYFLNIPFPI